MAVAANPAPTTSIVPPASVNPATATKEKLLIVGGGMAGFGLCDRLVRSGAIERYDVSLFGEEPTAAYDRVNLSQLFSGRTPTELMLAPADWYRDHSIEILTGRRVEAINRRQRCVQDQEGNWYPYDRLVLATGSHAWVPPLPGADLPGVFVYRTLEDLQHIQAFVQNQNAKVGAVLGGGLLGLEAAKVLIDLGLQTSVLEMAPGLMPRQLDSKGAALLKTRVESIGVDVHLVRRTKSIDRSPEGGLRIQFENAPELTVEILIIAAGVRPNDQLAKACALGVGPRGGIVVDETLQTVDPRISAIGECVSFRDHIYGLVAPCYRMADVLADRFAGGDTVFRGADESAELKLLGVQVATLGRAIGESRGGVTLTHRDQDGYRKLILEQGRLVGAACVGQWDEIAQIRQAIGKQQRLWPWQRRRFSKSGSPWSPGGVMPIAQWPADSVVCSCLNISKGRITALIEDGQKQPDQIAECCGASTACGSCRPLLEELVGGAPTPVATAGSTVMLSASCVALIATLAWVLVPPISFADSVQSPWRNLDQLWRDDFARQVTGFTTLGLTVIAMLFSARKRIAWFNRGSYTFWRSLHGVLGTAVLISIAVHTGMRLGANLNWLLGVCFLGAIVLGALVGMASSLENRATGSTAMLVRRWRPRLAKFHLWITWPLPVLIALHVFSFYWFAD